MSFFCHHIIKLLHSSHCISALNDLDDFSDLNSSREKINENKKADITLSCRLEEQIVLVFVLLKDSVISANDMDKQLF